MPELDIDVEKLIKDNLGGFYNSDRDKLRRYYRGKVEEILPEIFEQPSSVTDLEYEDLCKYFVYVNLLKPSVARLVSGVYGNTAARIIEKGSPYKDKVDRFLSASRGYGIKVRDAFRNAVHYGTGIIVYKIVGQEVEAYLPNPVRTRIFTDPNDVNDIWAIIEECVPADNTLEKQYRFTTKAHYGIANRDGMVIRSEYHGLGVVPVAVFYGEDQRQYGEIEGDSLVGSGARYSSVVSRLMLNMIELVLTFTDPKPILKGSATNREEAMDKGAVMEIDENGDFVYRSPETNFRDLSDTITTYLTYFCISEGIPLDALNPASVPENQSATSARLRNQPLAVTISRLVEEQISREPAGLAIVAALYQAIDLMNSPEAVSQDVDFEDIRNRFRANVLIEPSGSPESAVEEAAMWQQLIHMGAKELSDAIRRYNPTASETEIARRIDSFIAARDAQQNLQPDTSQVE